jgi:protocatechuate 3,4-dioxygenase beta subunit
MEELFTRRQSLAAIGAVTAGGLLAACGGDDNPTAGVTTTTGETTSVQTKTTSTATAALFDKSESCQVTAELTEGPYYIDVDRIRSDIREDREGTRLRLAFRVRDADTCKPIENALVELWHCDALGSYSGVAGDRDTYLRGGQVTNSDGIVEFVTVYPGWYQGRTVHFHVKIAPSGSSVVTTQVFTTAEFDEKVYASAPYDQRPGRDTLNENDGIFQEQLVLTLREEKRGVLGFTTFDVKTA